MTTPQKGNKIKICQICKEHEDEGDEAQIWWVRCSSSACAKDYHISCVSQTAEKIQGYYKHWYCPSCKMEKETKWQARIKKHRIKYQEKARSSRSSRSRSSSLSRIDQLDLSKITSEESIPFMEDTSPETECVEIEIVPQVPSVRRDLRNVITFIALVIFSIQIAYLYILYEF